jgi:hypothetical protein
MGYEYTPSTRHCIHATIPVERSEVEGPPEVAAVAVLRTGWAREGASWRYRSMAAVREAVTCGYRVRGW